MTDIRQLLFNPRKQAMLDNKQTAYTAEALGLEAPVDDDDLPHDVIERDDNDSDIAQTVS